MKKVRASTLTLAAAVLPALLLAYPAFGGGRGLFRIQNAMVEPEAGLTVSLHGLVRNADFPALANASNSGGWIADVIVPELSYAPLATEYVGLELFGSWGAAFQEPKSSTADGFVWGLNDLKAGAKLSLPVLPVLKLGGAASYTFRPREAKPGWQVLDPSALPQAARLAWGGLVTLQFQDITTPAPNFTFNVGRHFSRQEPEKSDNYYGAAAEMQGTGFALFAEAFLQQPDLLPDGSRNREFLGTKYGHVDLTPGIVIGSPASAFLKVGYTFSFGGESLGVKEPNELIVGLGYASPFGRRVRREYGQIVGTVADAVTGAPLAAIVSFPDHRKLGTLATDKRTGTFRAPKVLAGAVTVEASAAGYETQRVPLMVEDREVATAALRLRRATTPVEVTGRVSDRATGRALAATITVPEADSAVLTTDSATGVYRTRLMPGAYSMIVESPGYVRRNASMLVEKETPLARDFQLVAERMVITLRGVYFDFDQATIKPESRPALKEAARILEENPTIKVQIQGHTDSKGSDKYNLGLSDRRARAVVNYLVQELGADGGRLTAKGYGETRPVADNQTDAGRALNRRVEFVITGQTEEPGQISPDQR
jgi:outer membrane protein OmpA-like peptidoglycan-associated protein